MDAYTKHLEASIYPLVQYGSEEWLDIVAKGHLKSTQYDIRLEPSLVLDHLKSTHCWRIQP